MNRLLYSAMKETKKYLAYFTVLAIGCGWLGMDWLSSGSSTPTAEARTVAAAPQQPATDKSLPADMGDEPAIASRLNNLVLQRGLASNPPADGFAIPLAFRPPPVVKKAAVASAVNLLAKFKANHKLISVMVAGRASNAMVDGRLLQLGDQLDGFKLVEITQNSAVFSRGEIKASLNFQAQPAITTTSLDRR